MFNPTKQQGHVFLLQTTYSVDNTVEERYVHFEEGSQVGVTINGFKMMMGYVQSSPCVIPEGCNVMRFVNRHPTMLIGEPFHGKCISCITDELILGQTKQAPFMSEKVYIEEDSKHLRIRFEYFGPAPSGWPDHIKVLIKTNEIESTLKNMMKQDKAILTSTSTTQPTTLPLSRLPQPYVQAAVPRLTHSTEAAPSGSLKRAREEELVEEAKRQLRKEFDEKLSAVQGSLASRIDETAKETKVLSERVTTVETNQSMTTNILQKMLEELNAKKNGLPAPGLSPNARFQVLEEASGAAPFAQARQLPAPATKGLLEFLKEPAKLPAAAAAPTYIPDFLYRPLEGIPRTGASPAPLDQAGPAPAANELASFTPQLSAAEERIRQAAFAEYAAMMQRIAKEQQDADQKGAGGFGG